MRAKERKANHFRVLSSKLRLDAAACFQLAEQAIEFGGNVPRMEVNRDNPYIYAVALTIQHFYTSLKTAFARVVAELDGVSPRSEGWHKQLLDQVSIDIKDMRPALISRDLNRRLDRFRRFRHVVRHGYEYELDWEQIVPLVEQLELVVSELKSSFEQFASFLVNAAAELEDN